MQLNGVIGTERKINEYMRTNINLTNTKASRCNYYVVVLGLGFIIRIQFTIFHNYTHTHTHCARLPLQTQPNQLKRERNGKIKQIRVVTRQTTTTKHRKEKRNTQTFGIRLHKHAIINWNWMCIAFSGIAHSVCAASNDETYCTWINNVFVSEPANQTTTTPYTTERKI